MLNNNVTVDGDAQSFETPRKNNHDKTAICAQFLFNYDSLQYQQNSTTHSTCQKLPSSGKLYLCFQMDGKTSRAAQCAK